MAKKKIEVTIDNPCDEIKNKNEKLQCELLQQKFINIATEEYARTINEIYRYPLSGISLTELLSSEERCMKRIQKRLIAEGLINYD